MENIGKVYLKSILFCIISSVAFSGSPEVTVVIDGYTVGSTQSSPASLPLGTALVLVCRVSGIQQRQIQYNWTCPGGPCECPGYVGRKVVNGSILAVNITSNSDGGTYTCGISRDEADGRYTQNYTLKVSGGHVIHSYGRLVHFLNVITRGDQLLPPGNETAPGRMDCIRTAPQTARFMFNGPKPPNNFVSRSDDDGDQMDTVFFNRSHLSINTEGFCQGANSDTYFFLGLLPGTLPNVTIMRAVPSTTDVKIVLNDIPSDIGRVIIGYERHDLGVTLQGEYANIVTLIQHTFSSLVPGARYTVVVQGLIDKAGPRSQHVTRRDVKTEEIEPSAPRYPCILGESRDGIELNWIPPLEPNGDVYYLISDGNSTVNTSSGSTYFNITGLQRGVTYNITVVAMNSAGRSDTGPVLNYTHNPQTSTPPSTQDNPSANVTASVIGAIAVLLIVMSVIAVIIVIVIICIIKCNRRRNKRVSEGKGEADNTDHYYSVATENAGHYDVAYSRHYQDKYDMISSGTYINSAAAKKKSENAPKTHPNTEPSKTKPPEDINDEMPKKGNDPSELHTQPNKVRKSNEELYVNHDQVDPEELYTQPAKKKKVKKPPPYASRHKSDDPEALYTAIDKAKKSKN